MLIFRFAVILSTVSVANVTSRERSVRARSCSAALPRRRGGPAAAPGTPLFVPWFPRFPRGLHLFHCLWTLPARRRAGFQTQHH